MLLSSNFIKNSCCEIKIELWRAGEVSFDFLVCHGVLLLTDGDHARKKFLTRRTPFPAKMTLQKCQFWHFFWKKILKFQNVAEISGRNFCRKFWQHDGDPLPPKCPSTRFHEILCIIRKVLTLQSLLKSVKIDSIFNIWKQL